MNTVYAVVTCVVIATSGGGHARVLRDECTNDAGAVYASAAECRREYEALGPMDEDQASEEGGVLTTLSLHRRCRALDLPAWRTME